MNKVTAILKYYIVYVYRLFFFKKTNYRQWIFSSSFNTEFNYNSKHLFEYIDKNKASIIAKYVINDSLKKEEIIFKYKISENNIIDTTTFKGINTALESGVWFTSAGLPVYGFNLSKKRIIVNLWHGVPLKKIALLSDETSSVSKILFRYLFSNNYTYILTTSSNLINIMQNSFGVSKEQIKVWGQPRNDSLYNANDKKEILNELYSDLPKLCKAVLYAPTFREKYGTQLFPFDDFNIDRLNKFLEETNTVIFIRMHQSEIDRNIGIENSRIRMIGQKVQEDINDILNIFDLLITDYSSIYIDYLLINRPIIFLPYDRISYLSDRGLNFDYDCITPGPKPESFESFILELDTLLKSNHYYNDKRLKVKGFLHDFDREVSELIYLNVMDTLYERNFVNRIESKVYK